MMLNVNQMLASVNQEKIRENILYWKVQSVIIKIHSWEASAHEGLYMEEEHPNDAMTRLVEPEEVN